MRTRMTRKEMMGCVQDVLWKNKLIFKFEDGKKGEIGSSSLSYLCEKEEFGQEVDETISDILKLLFLT